MITRISVSALLLSIFFPIILVAQERYTGPLFDTSCQGGLEDTRYRSVRKSSLFLKHWNAHGVEGATMFVGVDVSEDAGAPGAAANYLKRLKSELRRKRVVYFMNIAAQSSDGPRKGLSVGRYRYALREISTRFDVSLRRVVPEIVQGVGEIEQYAWTEQELHVDDPRMLYFIDNVVIKNSFPFFMVHFPGGPGSTNFMKLPEIETVHFANLLSRYPDVTFLVHLFLPDFVELANSGGLDVLLENYPNWVFSVDVGNIMGRWEQSIFQCPLMYCCDRDQTCSSNDTDPAPRAVVAFRAEYDTKRDEMLERALAVYKTYIESYPDRFAWGTENGKLWHLNGSVYSRIIDFSRRFIGQLSPEVQEAFARGNARRIFLQ